MALPKWFLLSILSSLLQTFPDIVFAISLWASSTVFLLWICSVFPVVSNYTLLPTCSSNFLSLTLKSLKYLWKVCTFCFFCLLSLTYWFFFSENHQPTFCSTWVPSSAAHSGPLEIWQIVFSKSPAHFLQSLWLLFVPYPAVQWQQNQSQAAWAEQMESHA